jgi:hypothetical protein
MTKIDGGSINWNGDEVFKKAVKLVEVAMTKATIFTQGVTKEMIGGVGKGRLYRRGKGGKKSHRASAPGDPPARDTGILANSVTFEVKREGSMIIGRVGPDIDKIKSQKPRTDPDYGFWLDKGTKKIARRPWLLPSRIKAESTIQKIFKGTGVKI